jgi:hypothetical protein
VTVLSARCSARACPREARVHHRPPVLVPGHDHDRPPRKADERDRRAQPAASHRTHPPAVDIDPGADQPTTLWLPQPDSQRPPAAPRQRDARSLLPRAPRPAVAPRPGGRRTVAYAAGAAWCRRQVSSLRTSSSGRLRAGRWPVSMTSATMFRRSRASRRVNSSGKRRSSRPASTLVGTFGHCSSGQRSANGCRTGWAPRWRTPRRRCPTGRHA